jgi:hypothetical protein
MCGFGVGGGGEAGAPGGHPAADTQPVDVLSVCDLRLDPLRFGHRKVDNVLEPAHKDHPAEVDTAAVVSCGVADCGRTHSPPPPLPDIACSHHPTSPTKHA